jgi:hypothetical protein
VALKTQAVMTGTPDNEFLELLEDLFDCVDLQTAYVLEAIFSGLIKQSRAAAKSDAAFTGLRHSLLTCRDTLCEASGIEASHKLQKSRKSQKRVFH